MFVVRFSQRIGMSILHVVGDWSKGGGGTVQVSTKPSVKFYQVFSIGLCDDRTFLDCEFHKR